MLKSLFTTFQKHNGSIRRNAPVLFAAGAATVAASLAFGEEDKKFPAVSSQARSAASPDLYTSTTTTPIVGSYKRYASHLPLSAASSRFSPEIRAANNNATIYKRTQQLDVVSHVSHADPMLLALPAAFLACSFFMMPSMMLKAVSTSTRHLNHAAQSNKQSMLFPPLLLGLAAAVVAKTPSMVTDAEAAASTKQLYCPTYGCPMTPADMLYQPVQEALLKIANTSKSKLKSRATTQLILKELKSSGDEAKATLTLTGYKGGDLADQVNQDRAFVISPFLAPLETKEEQADDLKAHRLMGVFDGHADNGEVISEYCMTELPKLLAKRLSERLTPNLTEQEHDNVVISTFDEIYTELDRTAPHGESGGTTASVVLQLGKKLYIASTGDSPSFVCVHHSQSRETDVIYTSPDHKPDSPDERARIERMGGKVWIPTMRGAAARVLFTDPETGYQTGIAMSRSIGDRDMSKYGVIANPVVQVIDLEELIQDRIAKAHKARHSGLTGLLYRGGGSADKEEPIDDVHIFCVSASDGMMDILSAKGIAKFLVPSLCKENGMHLLTACEKLTSTAAEGWKRASVDGSYRDDIAISVSKIRTPPPSSTGKQR